MFSSTARGGVVDGRRAGINSKLYKHWNRITNICREPQLIAWMPRGFGHHFKFYYPKSGFRRPTKSNFGQNRFYYDSFARGRAWKVTILTKRLFNAHIIANPP
jgi:hypothetical protein